MRRRTLLAGIGALSAGCLGSSPTRTDATTSTTANVETTTSSTTETCDSTTETSPTETSGETTTGGEYRLTGLAKSTSTDRPSAKYVLEPSAVYSGEAVEQEAERTGEKQLVKNISELDTGPVRDAIETAIRTGEWRSNTLPDGVAETVERVDFFTGVSGNDTDTHVGLTLHRLQPDRLSAVEFDAAIIDDTVSEASPGVMALNLTNRSSTTQRVFSGTVPPFGVVMAESVSSDDQFLLWRNYESEGCVTFHDGSVIQCDIGTITKLRPCERISRRYEVLPSATSHHPEHTVPPGPGTYRISDTLSYYEEQGAPESKLSFEVEFTLESL